MQHLLNDPKSGITDPAGMILEPIQGEGGSVPAPDGWLREMRRMTRERDIPLILDEIQTGLGRTGETYAFEHADIVPDVVTLSKAVGGGLPLAVVVYDESLDVWEPGAHAGTFRGNQLAMAAGEATIDYVLENDLAEHAADVGARLRGALEATADRFEAVGDVRGRGLMLGVEFVDHGTEWQGPGPHAPDGDFAEAVQTACFERGLVVERGGRGDATARFLPPLVVTRAQVDEIAAEEVVAGPGVGGPGVLGVGDGLHDPLAVGPGHADGTDVLVADPQGPGQGSGIVRVEGVHGVARSGRRGPRQLDRPGPSARQRGGGQVGLLGPRGLLGPALRHGGPVHGPHGAGGVLASGERLRARDGSLGPARHLVPSPAGS